jgi:hypothetical protein
VLQQQPAPVDRAADLAAGVQQDDAAGVAAVGPQHEALPAGAGAQQEDARAAGEDPSSARTCGAAGFTARMNALTNLPSTSFAAASASTPSAARNARASSTP